MLKPSGASHSETSILSRVDTRGTRRGAVDRETRGRDAMAKHTGLKPVKSGSRRAELGVPKVVDRSTFQTELDALRFREKSHTREGDAIAAARRRLPMVEVDGTTPLIGEYGSVTLLDVFEGRRMLIAYSFLLPTGPPSPHPSP